MADWTMAGDIGRRLAELRAVLGETQTQFAARFGRTWKRVSAWENGDALPPQSALDRAARQAGWDTEMFAEGGPYPRQALERARMPQDGRSPRGPGRRAEDVELRAAALKKDAARLETLLQLIRAYRDAGRAPSPEVLTEWLAIAAANPPPDGPGR